MTQNDYTTVLSAWLQIGWRQNVQLTVDWDHCAHGMMPSVALFAVVVVGSSVSTDVLTIQLTRQRILPPGKINTRCSTERRQNTGQRESPLKTDLSSCGVQWRRCLSGINEHLASSRRHPTTPTVFSSILMRKWGLYERLLMTDKHLRSVQLLQRHFRIYVRALKEKSVNWSLSPQRSLVRLILFQRSC